MVRHKVKHKVTRAITSAYRKHTALSETYRKARRQPSGLLAHWFGSGLIPVMPGTWGSAAALPFAWAFYAWQGFPLLWIATLLVTLVGVWAAGVYAQAIDSEDPSEVVIDEVAGQWLTFAIIPPDRWDTLLAGFLLFRFFDILKPWPVRWADHHVHGGRGIMLDDLFAGVYGCLGMILIFGFPFSL